MISKKAKKISIGTLVVAAIVSALVLGGIKLFQLERTEEKIEFQMIGLIGETSSLVFPGKKCNIVDHGAMEGAEKKATSAINGAIEDCHDSGGGTVIVPAGKWLSGAIKLKSNIHLYLAEGAEIIFSTNLDDYLPVVFTRFQGMEFYNFSPLIYANDSSNIAITGKGKLNGSGEFREDWAGEGNFEEARESLFAMAKNGTPVEERVFGEDEPGLRPSFIQFVNSKNILLDGLTVENGPIWTIHPVYAENMIVRNLTIDTWSGNTDGIVIDSSKNVLVENCDISTGDDAVVIKSGLEEDGWRVDKPAEDILIRNITVTKGHGGVSIGSEMSGGVRNVQVYDSSFKNTRHGFRIKSTKSRGGFVEDVLVSDIEMENMSSDAIDINFSYSSPLKDSVSNKPDLKNVRVANIYGSGNRRSAIKIEGLSDSVMENISFENIFISSEKAVSLNRVRNISLKNIHIATTEDPAFKIENGQNIRIENSGCAGNAGPCIFFAGSRSSDIVLDGFDLAGKMIERSDSFPEGAVRIENAADKT